MLILFADNDHIRYSQKSILLYVYLMLTLFSVSQRWCTVHTDTH